MSLQCNFRVVQWYEKDEWYPRRWDDDMSDTSLDWIWASSGRPKILYNKPAKLDCGTTGVQACHGWTLSTISGNQQAPAYRTDSSITQTVFRILAGISAFPESDCFARAIRRWLFRLGQDVFRRVQTREITLRYRVPNTQGIPCYSGNEWHSAWNSTQVSRASLCFKLSFGVPR